MKKVIKYIVLVVVLGIVGLLGYLKLALPNVGDPEELTIELTPERIERGRYLANHVTVCMDCHSMRDWFQFSAPLVEGTLGKGGEEFNQKFGFPGRFFAPNITPAGLKDWTDGEILRAIASGVTKEGRALFPVMPHVHYGKMDREDLYSIIAYIRSIEGIENEVAESKLDFPVNFLINTMPQKAEFGTRPNKTDTLAYGAYMFNASLCGLCHTQQEKGVPIPGLESAGGFEFPLCTGGIVRSANITPDEETGIGNWTEEYFIGRFKAYKDSTYQLPKVKAGTFNTPMPWTMYSDMEEDDLRAIFKYMKTQKAVKNQVVKFKPE